MKKLLAIDGNSILNRAFYGVRPLSTRDGFPTNALYGMVSMIKRQEEALKPDYLTVAFDLKAPTFRHKMYDAYKAGRKPMPEELAQQLPAAKELLSAMGYHVLELAGYEADDILGTLANLAEQSLDTDAYLMTGDRDSLQLISPRVHVLLATNLETVDMNEERFFEKYGVKSSQFVDVKALMGDSSDNIPGVPGIGEKTALKLISDFGSLGGVYEQLPVAKHTPSVRAKLESGKESAYLSKTLATICREVPLNLSLSELAPTLDRARLRALFIRYEFSAFLRKYNLEKEEESPKKEAEAVAVTSCSAKELASRLTDDVTVALDDVDGEIFLADGTGVYRLTDGAEALPDILAGRTVVVYDVKRYFKRHEFAFLRSAKFYDLMLCAYLDNSSKNNFDFSSLASDYLAVIQGENDLRISLFLPLFDLLFKKLGESGQLHLLEDLEQPLAAVLADMEIAGFRIDREGIATYGEQLSDYAKTLEAHIYELAGCSFNINSPKQLGEVLFETLALPHAKKTKTGYSTHADILEKLRPVHPIIDDILNYRQVTKLKSTYVDGLLKVADETGRVHTNFKQTGTATGRLSSTEPNLQNIPIRTELGRELRRYFLPENRDYVIIDADYSQIELRLLAHISDDANMIRAFRHGADIHTSTAATVFGVSPEEVTSEMRKKAKAVNFGIMYGIGAFSLSEDIGVSIGEAQRYIDQYLAGYPEIGGYLKEVIQTAYEKGYVTTEFGRRRYIPELAGTNKVLQKFGERVAMNSPIQGTAADIIKLAMIRADRKLKESGIDARLILQVHDELLIEAHRSVAAEAEAILKDAMENAVAYSVPLSVEIHTADNWFDAK